MQAERFDAAIDLVCFDRAAAESSIRAFRGVGHFIQCSSVATYGRQLEYLPATEEYPLNPQNDYGRGKVAADAAFLEAHARIDFPVTILKPTITFGPKMGVLRQIGLDSIWLDRIAKGKPIIVSGDGSAIHQFMHVDDAGRAFSLVVGNKRCSGQIYNLVPRTFTRWDDYHRSAMRVLQRDVPMIGVPAADLIALRDRGVIPITDVFAHNSLFSGAKLTRDVPEFVQKLSLDEALHDVIAALLRERRIPSSDEHNWEDRVISAQSRVRDLQ